MKPHTLLLTSLLTAVVLSASAQGTAFTYQGQLQNDGSPASGTYNLAFSLFDTDTSGVPVAGPVTNNAVNITNGLFTVLIDFGPGVFTGASNWLEIAVETNGVNAFTTLAPRQQLTPVPYAIHAESAGDLSGTFPASELTSVGNTSGGSRNFFVGPSGNATTSGSDNTANGDGALGANTSGSYNTANGDRALGANTSGSANTANGMFALCYNTDGAFNTAGGMYALFLNTNGMFNTANGVYALYYNASGSQNTADGVGALMNSTSGSDNIALGCWAGLNITTGSNNIAIGNQGVSTDTNIIRIGSGQAQTFIAGVINGDGGGLTNLNAAQLTGVISGNGGGLINLNASQLTSIGNTGGGGDNFFVGPSGNTTTSGWENTAGGHGALGHNEDGEGNTAHGFNALYSNTSGSDNTASGNGALSANTSGSANTASGKLALYSNASGSDNTAGGYMALFNNTSGSANTASGFGALYNNTSGSRNIALGESAGWSITTGSNNIAIGNIGSSSDTNVIRIGKLQTATFIAGISGATAASGVAVYVNSSGRLGTLTSSSRYKQDIRTMGQSSDALYALKPVTFTYKPGIDPQGIAQFGLVAEDVEQVAPELVAHDEEGRPYTVRYEAVNAMLLNEFLKQHSTVEQQTSEIDTLKRQNDSLAARLNELEATVRQLAAQK